MRNILLVCFLIFFGLISSQDQNQTFYSIQSPSNTSLPSSWIGSYKIEEEKSNCNLLTCLCCPDKGEVVKIDKNTANREKSSFIIRGGSSGMFCKYQFLTDFLLMNHEENSTEAQGKLFDSSFRMIKLRDRIRFDNEDNPRCSFSIVRSINTPAQYDVVIDINSILEFQNTGWAVYFKDQVDYEAKSLIDTIVIGMAGHYNKGKTWLLNHLSSHDFDHGFHTSTVGLSMKYSDFDTKVASYLDTAGFETPIKYFVKENEYNRTRDQEETFSRPIVETLRDKNLKMKGEEWQKMKLKDRHFTEDLIQSFIFEKSHMILIVVGRLTFADQKMIHKILSSYGNSNKEILIIHNFHELEEIRHVIDMIDQDIFQSFDVKAGILEVSKKLQDSYYHQEIYINRGFYKVRHLVTAREGTEAGDYFNPPVFDFLQALIQSKSPNEPFDIVKSLAVYTENVLSRYIDFKGLNTKAEVFQTVKDGITYLKSQYPASTKLKPVTFDVNGALIKTQVNDHYLEYDMRLSNDLLVFTINVPGLKKDPKTGKRKINYRWERLERTCLVFEAEIEEKGVTSSDLPIIQTRKKGVMTMNPPCLDQGYDVEDSYIDAELEDGVLELTFPLIKKNIGTISIEL